MKKTKAIVSALLAAMMFCGFAAVVHAKTTKKQTKPTSSKSVSSEVKDDQEDVDYTEEKGQRLEDLTPDEIADIGVGAQIAAGQKPENVTVVTVTDLLPEEQAEEREEIVVENSSLQTAVAVLISLVSVLFVAVGVLYYFAYRAGLFNSDRR